VNVAILLVALLPALLMAAAMFDLATYTIPNIVPGAIILLFFILVAVLAFSGHPLTLSGIGFHALAGLVGLVAGVAFFALGWVGGGDAKLFAAAALWLGWESLFDYALFAAVLGGGLTLLLIAARAVRFPSLLMSMPWFARLVDSKGDIPYGVSLAIAAITLWPATELFRLAATS
jgi:prepilin peptidase CpaA